MEAAARRTLPHYDVRVAHQQSQLGTGDAARVGLRTLAADFSGDVLLGYGDMPMLNPVTLRGFIDYHHASANALSFISVRMVDGGSYGRVIRDAHGTRTELLIVDMQDASQIPALAEPWFLALGARLEMVPVMVLDDIKKAGPAIERACKKYA